MKRKIKKKRRRTEIGDERRDTWVQLGRQMNKQEIKCELQQMSRERETEKESEEGTVNISLDSNIILFFLNDLTVS